MGANLFSIGPVGEKSEWIEERLRVEVERARDDESSVGDGVVLCFVLIVPCHAL